MPTFGCGDTIRRAVESVLGQTETRLRLVVVNDGGEPPPLDDITDRRLVVHHAAENRGRYFCDAVVLAAADTEFFTIHDADDWSEPDRLERLLALGVEAAFGSYVQHRVDGTTKFVVPDPLKVRGSRNMLHVAHHTALYRTEALRRVGGPHPGFRVAYDTFMIAVVVNSMDVGSDPDAIYHHCLRPESLTQDPGTGMHTAYRRAMHRQLKQHYRRFTASGRLPRVPVALQRMVDAEAKRLRERLCNPSS